MFGSAHPARARPLSLSDCMRRMLHSGGAPLLLRGTAATLLRDAPVYGAYFLSYEWLKRYLAGQASGGAYGEGGRGSGGVGSSMHSGSDSSSRGAGGGGDDGGGGAGWGRVLTAEQGAPVPAWAMLTAGALAGVLSWMLALPVDVVKSQIQSAPLDAPREATRIAAVTARLYAAGGLPIFFRGLVPCLARAAPVNAVTFLGYELALQKLGGRGEELAEGHNARG